MDCVPAPDHLLSHVQVAARLTRMAQELEVAGHHIVAVRLVELVYAVLDGAARQ